MTNLMRKTKKKNTVNFQNIGSNYLERIKQIII